MVELSIIIPSYNTRELLKDCLSSIYQGTKVSFEIIIVDNGSKDESPAMVRENFPKVKLIENKINFGFARAVNQGLEKAMGGYLLLLNSDTVIGEEVIDKMVSFLKDNVSVGVVGCQLKSPDGEIQPSGGYLPDLARVFFWMSFIDDLPVLKKILKPYHVQDKNFYSRQQELDWVTGAFFATRREVFEKVGLFDEKMFMYVEEVDWCARAKRAGYKIIFNPSVSVIHYKGASTKRGRAGILEEYQGLKHYFKKHKSPWQFPILRLFLKLGALVRVFLFGIILKDFESKRIYGKAFRLA